MATKPTRKQWYEAAKAEVRATKYTRPNKYIKYYFGSNTTIKCSWCGIFVHYVLKKKLDAAYLIKGCANIAYVPTIYNWARNYKKITTKPQLGDLVLFDWEINNRLNLDHVGFFIKDLGNGYIQTLEGNTSNTSNGDGDCVQIRTRSKKYVACYINLDYAEEPVLKAYTGKIPSAYVSSKSGTKENVKLWQQFLNWYDDSNKLVVDGLFGKNTIAATKKFQSENNLDITGNVDKATREKAATIKK